MDQTYLPPPTYLPPGALIERTRLSLESRAARLRSRVDKQLRSSGSGGDPVSGIDINVRALGARRAQRVDKLGMAQFLGPVSDIVDPEDAKLRKLSEQLLLFGWYTLLGTRRAGWVDNVGDSGLLGPGPHHLCLNSPPPTSLADSFSPTSLAELAGRKEQYTI